MGSDSNNNKFKHQQQLSDRLPISNLLGGVGFTINTRMVEIKLILSALNFMGFSLYTYLLFINLDNVKGWILMIIGGMFGLAKLFFYIVRQKQAVRKERHEQSVREYEHRERLLRQQEQEIINRTNELDARVKSLYNKS